MRKLLFSLAIVPLSWSLPLDAGAQPEVSVGAPTEPTQPASPSSPEPSPLLPPAPPAPLPLPASPQTLPSPDVAVIPQPTPPVAAVRPARPAAGAFEATHRPNGVPIELTSLKLMREKGVISQAEFDSALHDLADTAGAGAHHEGTVVLGKWATTLYGFVEADSIYDSTRSFNDLAGSASVQPYNSNQGANSRWMFGVRNSRLGFRLKAPEYRAVRASAVIETDFQGTQLGVVTGPYPSPYSGSLGTSTSPYGSEGAFFTSPTLRVRHLFVKVETRFVDVLFGQYWALFGFGPAYQPNTVQIQGVPGEVYARTPQFRISKTIKTNPISIEIAVAAVRPAQRDAGMPDGQAGLKFNVDSWMGQQTTGSTGTQASPLSIAVSGLLRHVAVNTFNTSGQAATDTNDITMSAIAADAFVPVVPAANLNRDGALSVQGEVASGYGFADLYSGLTGGVGFPSPTQTKFYQPDIDAGIVTYDGKGGLHGVQWTTYLVGAQYYVPGTQGKFWLSGNYSHLESANSHYYLANAGASKVRAAEDWFDINAFVDPVPATRFGVEYANFNDMTVDGLHAINHRVQVSGFFIF